MANSMQGQALGFSAMAQAATLVHRIATAEPISARDCDTLVYSLFQFNPNSPSDVYGEQANLKTGKTAALNLLQSSGSATEKPIIMRYCASIIRLAKELNRNSELATAVASRLEHAERFVNDFSSDDSNRYSTLAGVYTDTLSKLPHRIHVQGNPEQLKNRANADKIRTLLLAGVRAAMLWQQCGGRRLNFVFKRGALVKALQQL